MIDVNVIDYWLAMHVLDKDKVYFLWRVGGSVQIIV